MIDTIWYLPYALLGVPVFYGLKMIWDGFTSDDKEEEEDNENEGENMDDEEYIDVEKEYNKLKECLLREIPTVVLKETETTRLIVEWDSHEGGWFEFPKRVQELDLFIEIFKKRGMFNKIYLFKYEDEDDTDKDQVSASFLGDDDKVYEFIIENDNGDE